MTSSYPLADRWHRRAAGMLMAAAGGHDLGGLYYPGGIVSFATLIDLWRRRGGDPDILVNAANHLVRKGKLRCLCETRGLISLADNPQSGDEEPDAKMTGGGYYPEVVPLTSERLPIGLGGTSGFDWDSFDSWVIDNGKLSTHLGRLLGVA